MRVELFEGFWARWPALPVAAVVLLGAGCASTDQEGGSQNPATAGDARDATSPTADAAGGTTTGGASSGTGGETGSGGATATGGVSSTGGAAGTDGANGALPYPVGKCPEGLPGPALVNVPGPNGTYCIDATEVTRGQYQEFVEASYGKQADRLLIRCVDGLLEGTNTTCDGDLLAPSCEGNVYEPTERLTSGVDGSDLGCTWWLSGMDDYPINCIDWCDAAGYCESAGKRLCRTAGPIHGELIMACEGGWLGGQDFSASAWERGTYAVPDRNDLAACNFNHGDPYEGLAPVGALKTCEGGYPGLFDLKGNVYEFSSGSAEYCCIAYGGAFNSTEVIAPLQGPTTTCAAIRSAGPTLPRHDIGFRCCADALPEEP